MRKTATSVLLGLLFSTGIVGGMAGAASASTDPGPTGNIEICKVWTPTTLAGGAVTLNSTVGMGFSFTVSNTSGFSVTQSVNAGTCSPLIAAPAGTDTITEAGALWYSVTGITQLPGQSYIVPGSINLAAQSVNVTVASGAAVDAVTYTDALVTGYVEVCKLTPAGSGLTGNFGFTLTSALKSGTFATASYAGATSATVGACSSPIQVPAGTITSVENGTNLYVTSITADLNGNPATNELVSSTPWTGTAVSTVLKSADVSTQTDIWYTDNVVALKVCKVWTGATTGVAAGQLYTFTVTPGANPAGNGPVPAPYTVSIQAGQCSTPVTYAPGTPVTITEGIVPGTEVATGGIVTTGSATTAVTPATSVINRTTSIIMGNGVTSVTNPLMTSTNEALVTFTDQIAEPGTLKVCKVPGTGLAPLGTIFNFTVANGATTYSVAVPLNECEFVVDSTGTPVEFPYNTTLLVTEAASTGNLAQKISSVPTPNVTELRGATTETALTNINLGSIGTTSSANVTISEDVLTEVTFADIDPPIVTNPTGNGTGVASTNGTNGAASNNNPLGTSNTSNAVVNANGVLVIVPTSGVGPSVKGSTTHVALTKAQEAKLVKLQKQLAADKAQVKTLSTKHYSSLAAAKSALKKITALKSQEKTLNNEIAALKKL
jgi:hypothetical protein